MLLPLCDVMMNTQFSQNPVLLILISSIVGMFNLAFHFPEFMHNSIPTLKKNKYLKFSACFLMFGYSNTLNLLNERVSDSCLTLRGEFVSCIIYTEDK